MHRLVPVLLITAYCRTAADAISVQGFNFPCQELPSLPQLRVHMLHLLAAGEGSLLDHAMVVYGSGLSDANAHSKIGLPVLPAGPCTGKLSPGRHIAFPEGTPMTNLFLSLLDNMNIPPETIGDSTGRLRGLGELG